MTVTLTREEAQSVLDALWRAVSTCFDQYSHEQVMSNPKHFINQTIETLRARLSAPEPEQTRSEKMREAGITRRPKGWSKEDEPEPVAWQPIDTAPKGKIVLVHYKNRLGNGRTMRAQYYLPETLESDESESGWADEGWYEESEAYEYLMPLEGEPTHWMPLPPAPDAAPPQREWQGLTDEEETELIKKWAGELVFEVTQALKEKNT